MRKADTGDGVLMLDVFLSKLEYADDAALINRTCEGASRRVTRIAKKARELADMEISVPKTECMFLRQYQECRQQPVSTEEYAEQKFKHVCEWCGMDYPSKDALTTHVHVHCKVRKGTREEEYPVEKVLDVRGRPEERFYLVHWKGYPDSENSWRNWRDMAGCLDLIDEFWEAQTQWDRSKNAWINAEVRCELCCKPFATVGAMKSHITKGQRALPGGCRWWKPSRKGTKAESAVYRDRRKKIHDQAGEVRIEGHKLANAFDFTYLGYVASADGNIMTPIQERMKKAAFRYSSLGHIWKSQEIGTALKLRLYAAAVLSVLIYGCEAWVMTDKVCRSICGWNSRRVAFITDREIRDEFKDPTYDLVARIRLRRLDWAGELLRAEEQFLARRVLVAEIRSGKWEGGLLMDAPVRSLKKLVEIASDKKNWRESCRSVVVLQDYMTEASDKKRKARYDKLAEEKKVCGQQWDYGVQRFAGQYINRRLGRMFSTEMYWKSTPVK